MRVDQVPGSLSSPRESMQIKITHKGLFIVFLPLVFELIFVGVLVYLVTYAESLVDEQSRSKTIIASTEGASARLRDAGRSLALFGMTRIKDYAYSFDNDLQKSKSNLEKLSKLVSQHPTQADSLTRFKQSVQGAITEMNELRCAFDAKETMNLLDVRMRLDPKYRQMSTAASEIVEFETISSDRVFNQLKTAKQQVYLYLMVGIFANVGLCVGLAVFFSRDITRRLSVIVDNTDRLQGGESSLVEVDGTDEIALLGRRFNSMAAALEDAARKERAIVDRALDVIFSLDSGMRFIRVNPAAHALLGYALEELTGQRIGAILHKDTVDESIGSISQCRDDPSSSAQFACPLLHKDGSIRWIDLSVYWSAVDESYFCVAHDITERKKLEQLKGDFINMISHDLRTPLSAVSAFLELLEDGAYGRLPERGMSTTKRIRFNVERLVTMISDLLDVEKIESGNVELDLEDVNIHDVVETAVSLVKEYALLDGINIEVMNGDSIVVNGDRDKLERVALNLISNAIKFSKPQSTVNVDIQSSGETVTVGVTDEGEGIEIENQAQIFERYKQVKDKTGIYRAGTGLGLAICKEIVMLHDGEIGVESEPGFGSTFWFRLPIKLETTESDTI